MARNEHDGRSLEERLASLDAMSGETAGRPAAEGEPSPERPAVQEGEQTLDQNGNPWLAAPPAFQGPPENFGPPQEQPSQGEAQDQGPPAFPAPPPFDGRPYEGGPMPQPFEGGMLPPPYAGYQDYDQPPSAPPAPPAPASTGSPATQPQQSPYGQQQPWETGPQSYETTANGEAAPPLDQLPPYMPNQFVGPDPNSGPPPYAQDPSAATGQQYPPQDPNAGQPYAQETTAVGQFPPIDPNSGQPFQQDVNGAGGQYPPPSPPAGQQQRYAQDPNAGQPYPPLDPNTGQPYAPGPGTAGQPYGQNPNAAGQPYAPQDPNAAAQQGYAYDPNTGQALPQAVPGAEVGPPHQGYAYGPQGQPGAYQQMPGQPPGAPQSPYPGQPQPDPQSSESLSSENLLGERRIAPSSGWRRAVYKATAGSIHPGESQGDLRRKDLIARARTTVAGGHHRVAVMSLKGGVGKTTTTTGLGSMLGSFRGDRVIAVDANPDRGTLSDKVKLETAATVRDLLNSRDKIHRYADVRAFTSQNVARLEVLASDRDPAVSEAFSAEDYAAVAVVLEQYYSICITDCGTGLLHSAMAGVLSLADQLVLVSSPSVDGARSASATLDWLEAHDHGHLVRNGVVVLSMVRNRTRSQVDLDKLQAHFESRCRAVVRIPYDDHLEEGAEVELEQLAPATREAYLTLAAVVGDGFAHPRPEGP
ncbi:MinD/ParA family ATP-binding protein [Actinomadura macra]|uniref:MinD/ParA family ATP-binding protein n=1 Tax=Actinomadura macra TaxID=46164 RepID=UPI000A6A5C59|nr:MinD/ParA family protein [Actinomadura macra]